MDSVLLIALPGSNLTEFLAMGSILGKFVLLLVGSVCKIYRGAVGKRLFLARLEELGFPSIGS